MQILLIFCKYLNSLIFLWNVVKFIKVPDFSTSSQIPWFSPDWKTWSHFSQLLPDFQCEWEPWYVKNHIWPKIAKVLKEIDFSHNIPCIEKDVLLMFL